MNILSRLRLRTKLGLLLGLSAIALITSIIAAASLMHLAPGDLLAILDAGAYGMSLSSNYNTRGRAAEVLVEGKKVRLVRRRESFEDLIRSES